MSNDIKSKTLDDLAEELAKTYPTHKEYQRVMAEFYRRQTSAIQDAAAAAKDTAASTKKYTLYMFISVVVLLVSVVGTLILSYLNYINSVAFSHNLRTLALYLQGLNN